MNENPGRIQKMVEPIAKLIGAGKLKINYTEYEMASEFHDAVEHAAEPHKNTKVVLRNKEVAITY